ncbi:MAG: N-acetyl sugar amidotransferase [Verrucomicrobia bacterium]|nr:N-acetyl sugar amidotransferase [Verrucomicrobiota bacterium]
MKYCTHCLQPDTRPNSYFTPEGLCPACNYHRELQAVDWQERYEILEEFLQPYRRRPEAGPGFDCIIGVSGGKDSTRQALWARDKLGLRPLLVCLSYPPQQVTERGTDNISNLIELGFDTVISALAPETWRRMLREGFFRFTNWARATEQALISSVPQLAVRHKIPLILWGENPGLQLGDMKTLGRTGYDGNNLRFMNTVSGGGLGWMLEAGFRREELPRYLYPQPAEFDAAGIQIVYLGWFWKDWSIINNGLYACANGLEIRSDSVENTGDLRGVASLDEDWVTLNQMIKYYKFGFGRVTDYANEEIRHGRMARARGIELVEHYDDACNPAYIESFCAFIDITVKAFWQQVHASVNPRLFAIEAGGRIRRRFKVGTGL